MKVKKIEKFIKEYFYFSQTERLGILKLLTILAFALIIPLLYKIFFPAEPYVIQAKNIQNSSYAEVEINQGSLFNFDPNTASVSDLKKLGFSDKNSLTIQRFIAKGGSFKKPEDLSKIYSLKPELVQKLIPFVVIQNGFKQQNNGSNLKDSTNNKKYGQKIPLEINTADTNALIALYRIGPGLARRIVEYRNKLGGYLQLVQLTEIYGFDEDILYDLKGKIYVDASKAKIYNLNTVSLDELKTHPYFKYKLSSAIVNYRAQHGSYQSLNDLKKIVIINDSIFNNISQYLIVK